MAKTSTGPRQTAAEKHMRKAFEAWTDGLLSLTTYGDGTYMDRNTGWVWQGWYACWKYLEKNAYKEFIER